MHRLWSPLGSGWPSAARIGEFRERKLRRLIRHAAARVPWYREHFRAAGVSPDDLRTVADLTRLPVTSRADLKSLPRADRMVEGTDPARLIERRTSGSTGTPLSFFRTLGEDRRLGVYRVRALRDMGQKISDHRVSIEVAREGRGRQGLVPGWLQKLGVLPRTRVDCTQAPERVLERLRSMRADVVGAYASYLFLLSRMAGPAGLAGMGVRSVTSSGEVLTPMMRRSVEACFQAPVRNTYATLELNLIAYECAETGLYHLMDHSVIAEVVRNGRPAEVGERGELILTGLHSLTAPFLRYRIGDIVTRGPERCPCGAPFATIRAVEGRMNDLLTLPDGRVIHPIPLKEILNNRAPWAVEYQFVQETLGRLAVDVVPTRTPSAAETADIEASLRQITGPDVEVCVRLTDEIARDPSSKFRVIRSQVESTYDEIDWDRLDDGGGRTGLRPSEAPGAPR